MISSNNKIIEIAYFSFKKENHIKIVSNYIEQLTVDMKHIGISLPKMNLKDGPIAFPEFYKLLQTRWQANLQTSWGSISIELGLVLNPEAARFAVKNKWVSEVLSDVGHLTRSDVPELVILDFDSGTTLCGQPGLHGAAQGDAKALTAFVGFNRLYFQLVYHEMLHFFGVSDGYDLLTTETIPGCEKCWMQYEPSKGAGLCETHEKQLNSFLVSL